MKEFFKKYARKQSKYVSLYVNLKDVSLDLESGEYSAFAVDDKNLLEDPYAIEPSNYIFTKSDAEIRAVSDFENSKINIPCNENDFDQEGTFWLVIILDIAEYAREKVIIEYSNCINDSN